MVCLQVSGIGDGLGEVCLGVDRYVLRLLDDCGFLDMVTSGRDVLSEFGLKLDVITAGIAKWVGSVFDACVLLCIMILESILYSL